MENVKVVFEKMLLLWDGVVEFDEKLLFGLWLRFFFLFIKEMGLYVVLFMLGKNFLYFWRLVMDLGMLDEG